MQIVFTPLAFEDYRYWAEHDRKMLKRLNRLIDDCCRAPFDGIGKPEPLRNELSGFWSRRIDEEHRLVYRIAGEGAGQRLEIVQCRFHY